MARRRLAAFVLLVRCTHGLLLPSAPVRVPLPRGPTRCRRAGAVALRAAPQKYDDTTAPLAATLRSSEFAAAAATGAKALAPSVGLAIVGTVAFGPLAVWLRTFINGEGLAVLANDEGQYFQNYVNAIDVMFSLLLVNTFAWLYNQQEQLYVSLFAEVSVAKALLEQIAYVSRGRPEYAAQLLSNVRRYVDDDLTKLSAEPVTALLGGSSASYADPLEQVLARRGYLKPSPPRHRRDVVAGAASARWRGVDEVSRNYPQIPSVRHRRVRTASRAGHVAHVRGLAGRRLRDRAEPARGARAAPRRVAAEAPRGALWLVGGARGLGFSDLSFVGRGHRRRGRAGGRAATGSGRFIWADDVRDRRGGLCGNHLSSAYAPRRRADAVTVK